MLLHHKLELALVAYINAHKGEQLAGWNITEAHTMRRPDYPVLVVCCMRARPHPDFDGLGRTVPHVVPTTFHFRQNANDLDDGYAQEIGLAAAQLDTILTAVADPSAAGYAELAAADRLDYSALLCALNPPASGPDTRPQTGLYCFAIHPGEDAGDGSQEVWEENLNLDFHVQNGDPAPA